MTRLFHTPLAAAFLFFLAFSPTSASYVPDDQLVRQLNDSIGISSKYVVKACLADGIGKPCTGNTSLETVPDLRITQQSAPDSCEATEGQKGSVSYTDLMLPTLSSPGKVLLIEVTTKVPGQDSSNGFFVRPTRLTRYWGKATVSSKTATFYLAETGQVSRNQACKRANTRTNCNSCSNLATTGLYPYDVLVLGRICFRRNVEEQTGC